MPLNNPSFTSNGNIYPSSFVVCDQTAAKNFMVIPATTVSTAVGGLLGISSEAARDPGGISGASAYAAIAGDPIDVYGPGDVCLLHIGGSVTAGNLLISDGAATAYGVIVATPAGGLQFYGAKSLQTGIADDLVRVLVVLGAITT